ncbi:MAG: Nif3-like dinuclear metal center hexameric protein [Bacteroidales bacterium]|nr:Nif3-like dinuclear metal center hexameric protein [Bacteroidales bacterium]
MKFTIKEFLINLEQFIPVSWQENYDNSGLQIGDTSLELKGVVLCVDVDMNVLQFAHENDANLVISHHPLFFHPLRNIPLESEYGKIISYCITHQICVFTLHTNLDKSRYGVNFSIAEALGLENVQILEPERKKLRKLVTFCPHDYVEKVREAIFKAGAGVIGNYDSCSYNVEGYGTFRGNEQTNPFVGNKGQLHKEPETRVETIYPVDLEDKILEALFAAHPYEEVAYDIYPLENNWPQVGLGVAGMLPVPLPPEELLKKVKDVFDMPILRFVVGNSSRIHKVALCGGSGIGLLRQALKLGADAFITSDIRYHDFIDAYEKIWLIDAGHYEMEYVGLKKLFNLISKFSNFANVKMYKKQNKVQYF